MKPSTALDILDAAYARDTSDDVWLTRVTRAVRPNLDRGLGVTGYFVRIGGPGEFEGHGHVGPTKVDVLALWNGLIANADASSFGRSTSAAPSASATRRWSWGCARARRRWAPSTSTKPAVPPG